MSSTYEDEWGEGPAIVTDWRADSSEPAPAGTPAGVAEIQRCTGCGELRTIWANDTTGLDPWKKHFDYCEGEQR